MNLLRLLLAPFGLIYRTIVQARIALYRAGVLATHRLTVPVISVGNLTVGGTGKTPCVAYIAGYLQHCGAQVAILSRGYRRASSGLVEVSDGSGPLCGPELAGDEPWLLARSSPGVRVVVEADRYRAGVWLAGRSEVSVFLLDDGYQHVRLARDLNLLLVDAGDPLDEARMVPSGRLREPLDAMDRADAVIVTRSDRPFDRQVLRSTLDRYLQPGTPVFYAWHEMSSFRRLSDGEMLGGEDLKGVGVAAIAGIARPERFYHDLEAVGARILYREHFPDHHRYDAAELERVVARAVLSGAEALILTEKDAANLPSEAVAAARIPILAARIEFRCSEEESFKALLRRASRL